MKDFGIILACYKKDYRFAKGCCASIRYFLGDIPICLLVDGSFPVAEVVKAYDVNVIYRNDVANQVLKNRSFGYGLTKMVAFWESPFQHFLFMDADTIAWGNILKYANFENFDFVVDRTESIYLNDSGINRYFFNTEKLEQCFPNFNWQKYRYNYFVSGVFFAKKGIFELAEYEKMLYLREQHREMFKLGEQGLLNLMIFQGVEQGKFRLKNEYLQIFGSSFIDNLQQKKRFSLEGNTPILQGDDASVIHWAGGINSPLLARTEVYNKPMTFFRQKCLRDYARINSIKATIFLYIEDFWPNLKVYGQKLAKQFPALRQTLAGFKKFCISMVKY
ncbi:conserved hypothetical protein [Hyella patelloides LEGE 07179]|uniref:Glycosyl transferase family 8 n=1 Tax=Hyella patelloides LEGE 07179 TaxID=945734 RepID=A0A563VMN3_9CYAN|nr:hypothetical protein [Hyella patelloides]VEP12689.1 conserved hypothetical protein [Hyella patelloides LEGE 07179]